MDEADVEFFRKRMTDRESRRIIEGEEMNEDLVRLICAANDGYDTPELNDKLYLHFKGFSRICNLEKFSACKSLWLESNRIEVIENIGHMKQLASLFLHNNRIRRIQNLEGFADLVTLNLSSNLIEHVEGLSGLKNLQTLNLSKNLLATVESIAHLGECHSITNLDLSSNSLADEGALEVFGKMQELTQLYLHGNDLVKTTRHYRKTVLLSLPSLTYLDQRPIFEKERLAAEAWKVGGREAEEQAVKDHRQSLRDKEKQRRESFRKWKQEQAELGEANRRAGVVPRKMVSYVNVNSDAVTAADFPPNSEYIRRGIVPLSHNSRPVAADEENLGLYGANTADLPTPGGGGGGVKKNDISGRAAAAAGVGGGGDDDDDDQPPPLPGAEVQSHEQSSGGGAAAREQGSSAGSAPAADASTASAKKIITDWNDDVDAWLAKLVRKHAFDFAKVAAALRKKIRKRNSAGNGSSVEGEERPADGASNSNNNSNHNDHDSSSGSSSSEGEARGDFVTGESCRLRWCGLDYLRYKKKAIESPRRDGDAEQSDDGNDGASAKSGGAAAGAGAPALPEAAAAAAAASGTTVSIAALETDMDELD